MLKQTCNKQHVEQCNDVKIDGLQNENKTEFIFASLLKQKENDLKRSDAQKCKLSISIMWEDNLKLREKHFRNYIKNAKKQALFDEWKKTSPEYLPLKFRIKYIPGELPEAQAMRITRAKTIFSEECELMKSYATSHRQKYEAVDALMLSQFSKK